MYPGYRYALERRQGCQAWLAYVLRISIPGALILLKGELLPSKTSAVSSVSIYSHNPAPRLDTDLALSMATIPHGSIPYIR